MKSKFLLCLLCLLSAHTAAPFSLRQSSPTRLPTNRTPPAGPGRLAEMILFNAEKLGIRDRITLITYDYARQHKTVENPYQGLLHEADHIVYESGSSSIMSEALFTGKSLHMANHYYDCDALVAAKAITPPAPHAPFVTKPIRLPDATAAVARAIARQYRLKTLFR
jgi:hypothetical protein